MFEATVEGTGEEDAGGVGWIVGAGVGVGLVLRVGVVLGVGEGDGVDVEEVGEGCMVVFAV
ncbi:MAG: hypothetical protein AAB874_02360 [Patescibacteria group bacterium]